MISRRLVVMKGIVGYEEQIIHEPSFEKRGQQNLDRYSLTATRSFCTRLVVRGWQMFILPLFLRLHRVHYVTNRGRSRNR